jgi:putative membrane protein
MYLLPLHMLLVFAWGASLLSLIKSVQLGENSKILSLLSGLFMLAVLFVGTKLMLMFPGVAKSGMWIHVKLSIDIIAMLVNIYLIYAVFRQKHIKRKFSETLYWAVFLMFIAMYCLTLFKPF